MNPSEWKPGDTLDAPEWTMKSMDVEGLSVRNVYKFMVSAVTPRPIGYLTTQSKAGINNLAPFSFFNGVGSAPPSISVSIVPKGSGELKDTLKNILETKEFVVNGASEWILPAIHHSSAEYPSEVSEIEKMGLLTLPSEKVAAPRIKGCCWHMECRLYDTMTVGDGGVGSATLVVGEILQLHVAEEVFKKGAVDYDLAKPVARIGGMDYVAGGEKITMPRVDF